MIKPPRKICELLLPDSARLSRHDTTMRQFKIHLIPSMPSVPSIWHDLRKKRRLRYSGMARHARGVGCMRSVHTVLCVASGWVWHWYGRHGGGRGGMDSNDSLRVKDKDSGNPSILLSPTCPAAQPNKPEDQKNQPTPTTSIYREVQSLKAA